MSGGTWNYVDRSVANDLDDLSAWPDGGAIPLVSLATGELASWIHLVYGRADQHLSGDEEIPIPLDEFERRELGALIDRLLRIAPEYFFSRGKWATIHALQANSNSESAHSFINREGIEND